MKEKSHNEKRLFTLHAGNYFAKQRDFLLSVLTKLDCEKSWDVVIQKHKKKRSNMQNSALWGVAYKAISEETGNSKEDLHEYFLGEFGGWEDVEVMGVIKARPTLRSSKMDTKTFKEFYEFIQMRASELGYYVPSPNEYELMSEAA